MVSSHGKAFQKLSETTIVTEPWPCGTQRAADSMPGIVLNT